MTINNCKDSQDHDVLKPAPAKRLIIEKYKRLAKKDQKKQDCTDIPNEPGSTQDCVEKENEKSDDSRDTSIEQSSLKDVKRMKVSIPVSSSSESERRVQLTKKTIMQERLFKLSCNSTGDEQFKKSPEGKEPGVNKTFKNNPRQQNNRSRMQNGNKSWKQQSTNQKGNKSNRFVQPTSSSKNSFEAEGNKDFQNYSKQQNDGPRTNDNKSNKLVVPSSSLDSSPDISTSTSSAENKISSSQSKLTSSESISNVECESAALHLKKPLVNKQNEANYYENHGRMEPMSWSTINSREDTSSKKSAPQKVRLTKESIEKLAARKDEVNKEFLNFVASSTNSNTVFHVHSNVTEIKKNAFPLSKIKANVDKKIGENLQVTAQIKEKFTPSQIKSTTNRVIDLIECIKEQSLLLNKLINEKTVDNKENSSNSFSSKLQEKIVEKSKDFHLKKESKNILSTPLKENLVNTTKKQSDVEDDMFNFEKPTINVSSSIKEDESSRMSSSAKKLSIQTQEYFTKLKQFHKTQLDSSIDSDDLSLACTSEIDDLSALRGSTCSKFEAVTKKISNASTEEENEKLEIKASQSFDDFIQGDNKKRIAIEETELDTIPNEIKNQLIEKVDSKSSLEFDADSGLGFTTSKDESDSEESYTIFHKHSNVPSSVVIQEIDSTSEAKSMESEMQSENLYEDIDSEAEFDIVNVEEFGPCAALLKKLKAVAATQKAMATGIINEEDAKAIMGFEENNNEIVADEVNKEGVKAIMGPEENNEMASDKMNEESVKAVTGLEESNNEMNSQITKYNSNETTSMEKDEDEPAVAKDNISEKEETDKSGDSGYPISDYDNTPKICNPTTTKAGVSKRMQKMKNALHKYQKKYKTKDTGEGSPAEKVQQEQQQQEQQRPIDAQKNQSLGTAFILPRHQILNEILKQKLHLQCKPMLVQGLKLR